ncbi:hypothetical protein NUU61_005935, partial [Penicillium alfredii]
PISLSKSSKMSTGQLPKSVKVRSTCNACQQAKIRCSHEKPSCRRCQKHKIDCIYSVSRRLGRPAKKTDPRSTISDQDGGSPSPIEGISDEKRTQKQTRKRYQSSKSKTMGSISKCGNASQDIPIGDNTQMPILMEMNSSGVSEGLEMDLPPESWLQELMSTHINDAVSTTTSSLVYGDVSWDAPFELFPESFKHHGPIDGYQSGDEYLSVPIIPESATETSTSQDLNVFPSSARNEMIETSILQDTNTSPWAWSSNARQELQSSSDCQMLDVMPSLSVASDQLDPSARFQSSEDSNDDDMYSPENSEIDPLPVEPPGYHCGCFKQGASELVESGLRTGRSRFSSLDSILVCQRELQNQAEVILQCRFCPQSEARANMLMIIMVTIDSFVTALEAISSAGACVDEERSPLGKGQNELGSGFQSYIEALPLLVGGFVVPVEEKARFIRHVLQARLSMLLLTIRRIRVCTQQVLAITPSRGRLMMMGETDRRLQLVIMKISMVG